MEESTSRTLSWLMPAASLGTAKSVMPSASSSEPDVRAATTIMSALAPWMTKLLAPDSLNPLPDLSARVVMRSGRCLAVSSMATANTQSPAISPGR
jgi:hypothetical protein